MPLKVVRDSHAGPRQAYAARLVLVRPEQYVAWNGDAVPRDVSALMQTLTGEGF